VAAAPVKKAEEIPRWADRFSFIAELVALPRDHVTDACARFAAARQPYL
jgi:hypothetical protein